MGFSLSSFLLQMPAGAEVGQLAGLAPSRRGDGDRHRVEPLVVYLRIARGANIAMIATTQMSV
jgi:hypothetical protein